MSRREELRLRNIAAAIATIRSHVAGGEFDRKTKVVGLRNLVAHEYFRVDLDVIQSILSEQLDQLEETAKRLLDEIARRRAPVAE